MTIDTPSPRPLDDLANVLLADIAVRLQLSPSSYERAVERYETVSQWIERPESPLHGKVSLFYPQGSMSTGSTIAARLTNDEFDIDVVAQLELPTSSTPAAVLRVLFDAIRGSEGSRYHSKTTQNSRCVTVGYADMHLDVTPAFLIPGQLPRVSTIFHSKREAPRHTDQKIIANPYGFSEWFKAKTAADADFAKFYDSRMRALDVEYAAKAEAEDVPPQDALHQRSISVVVLQLLKRWRNINYDDRPGRQPPSVLIAKLVADSILGSNDLCAELIYQATKIRDKLTASARIGQLIEVRNPACSADVFTDRWPASQFDQKLFAEDLNELLDDLYQVQRGLDLSSMQQVLAKLFGESTARTVLERFNYRLGAQIDSGNVYHTPGQGRIALASTLGIPSQQSGSAHSRRTDRHTYYGSK